MALTALASSLNPKGSPPAPPMQHQKSPASPQKKTSSEMPTSPQKTKPILSGSSIDEFVDWCQVTREEDWSSCLAGMRNEAIYPDEHLSKITNEELRGALGLGIGAVHRFRAAASDFWKLQVEKHCTRSADHNALSPHPITQSSGSNSVSAGQKRKGPSDDWIMVQYKRKYPVGEKRITFRHYTDGRTTTYDGAPVFNVPNYADADEWWEQYIDEQVKLHTDEGVQDFVELEPGYWLRIPPTGKGFFNPLTDNTWLYAPTEDYLL